MSAGGEKYARGGRAAFKLTAPPRILRRENSIAGGKQVRVGAGVQFVHAPKKPVLSRPNKNRRRAGTATRPRAPALYARTL
jgi:hypothetical protein